MHEILSCAPRATQRPLVSVILSTYNEARCIENCLGSILGQETTSTVSGDFDLEVLAIDGMSLDGTREILERCAAREPRLRVLTNQRRYTPFAFNLGLRHARGEYVCIFGAHTVYRSDYIAMCLSELLAHDAAACGGRVITTPSGSTLSARLTAWAMSHPFGSSRKSFRTQKEGAVDTVNYPLFRRDVALAVGGYDEELLRNQDNDLNQKLRARGHVLWCTWKTQCQYFPKGTVSGLFQYAFRTGHWNAVSHRKNPDAMSTRHFVPLAFVLCLALFCLIALAAALLLPASYVGPATLPLAGLLGVYLILGTGAALHVALRERSLGALCLPLVFLGFHLAYGYGTVCGFARSYRKVQLPRQQPQRG